MMVEEQFYDIMHRTMVNLNLMDQLHNGSLPGFTRLPGFEGPYEVTQLLNSFLGAFALPLEKDLHPGLETIQLDEAYVRWGMPRFNDELPAVIEHGCNRRIKPENVRDLARFTRNSVMHGDFILIPTLNDIGSIQITRRCVSHGCNNIATWRVTLDLVDLRRFLEAYVRIAEHLYEQKRLVAEGGSL